ncbi:methyltransferase [Alcanivorax sp. 521-1]|uniref:Methyltransferase n=1 Tax=Alloalcanivorax profundimaris TaxID=2735259 RepID=A0ABS0AUI1_9GAMM|nr:hypothetical protein [Alloalcanivorax profundimaris]MBF5057639.1 methyltransferase [Alloalcanivorax profundimaris]
MNQDQIKALFDQQAEGYDAQWSKTAPIRECLHFLLGGLFADLPEYEVLLRAWMTMMASSAVSQEMIARMRHAYANDVGVLPPTEIASMISAGGFQRPVPFFQAGLLHAWCSRRADSGQRKN